MVEQSPDSVFLDRSGDVWVGGFRGLGRIEVAPDGGLTIEAEHARADGPDAGETLELRRQALRYGWGEALSWIRRGFALLNGAAVCPPGPKEDGCLILSGDPHDTAILILELAGQGWTVLGDCYTPMTWRGDDLVAWPREAPLLFGAKALTRVGGDGVPVRDHTDVRTPVLQRCDEPRKVAAFCHLQMRTSGEKPLVTLVGHERFEAAASVMLGGALRPDIEDTAAATAGQRLAEHIRLAALPHQRLRIDRGTASDDTQLLTEWWSARRTEADDA